MDNSNNQLKPFELGIGQRIENAGLEHNWKNWDVSSDSKSFNEPTLLCLGGMRTKTPKAANGLIKNFIDILKKTIPPSQLPVQFVSIYFDDVYAAGRWHLFNSFNGMKHDDYEIPFLYDIKEKDQLIDVQYVSDLYDRYIAPIISKTDENGIRSKLSIELAQKNASLLNIGTLSHGSFLVTRLSQKMEQDMLELGYTRPETKSVQEQVSVLSFGTVMPLSLTNFKTLHIMSRFDAYHTLGQKSTTWNSHLCRSTSFDDNTIAYVPVSKNESVLICDRFFTDTMMYDRGNEHVFFDGDKSKLRTGPANYLERFSSFFLHSALCNSLSNNFSSSFVEKPSIERMIRFSWDDVEKEIFAPVFDEAIRNGKKECELYLNPKKTKKHVSTVAAIRQATQFGMEYQPA